MQNNRNLYAAVGIFAAIVVIVVGAIIYAHTIRGAGAQGDTLGTTGATSTQQQAGTASSTAMASTSTDGLPNIPGATVTPIHGSGTVTGSAAAAPDYTKPLSYAGVSADTQATYQASFAQAQTALAKDATDWAAWISLAQLRKATGDYAGAEADLTYVTALYPKDPTAYANLGDLYANYLHEQAKAAASYQEAISLDPVKQAQLYANLADALTAEGRTAQAKATLEAGIDAKVVGYQSLETKLSSLQ